MFGLQDSRLHTNQFNAWHVANRYISSTSNSQNEKKQTYPILKTLSVSDCKGELIANDRNCCPTRTWTGSAMQSICIWVEIFWFQVWICRFWRFLAFQFPWSWCLKAAPGIGMFSKCFNIRCFSRGMKKFPFVLKKSYTLDWRSFCMNCCPHCSVTKVTTKLLIRRRDLITTSYCSTQKESICCHVHVIQDQEKHQDGPPQEEVLCGHQLHDRCHEDVVSSAAQKVILGLSTDV